jgi:saccharopine dehydrogenase-like NADP-dependent oxidoreductase
MRIHEFVEYLDLEFPYTIKLKSKGCRDTARYWNMVNDEHGLEYHLIHVYLGNLGKPGERDLETLIAHELIHAWQTEQNMDEIHGKGFIKMAGKMSKKFDLPRIYIPEVDIP